MDPGSIQGILRDLYHFGGAWSFSSVNDRCRDNVLTVGQEVFFGGQLLAYIREIFHLPFRGLLTYSVPTTPLPSARLATPPLLMKDRGWLILVNAELIQGRVFFAASYLPSLIAQPSR